MTKPFLHLYAPWVVEHHNTLIYQEIKKGNKTEAVRVLRSDNLHQSSTLPEQFKWYLPEPKVTVGSFQKSQDIVILRDMDYLRRLGFVIKLYKNTYFEGKHSGLRRIRTILKLVREKDLQEDDGRIIARHALGENKLLYDRTNHALKLEGKNSDNEWVYIKPKRAYSTPWEDLTDDEKFDKAQGIIRDRDKKRIVDIPLDLIPVGISYVENKIVLIPTLKDTPSFGFVGQTGKGKTIFMLSLLCQLYWRGKKWIHLNDWKGETLLWTQPVKSVIFRAEIEKLNLEPMPLPIVPLYPIMNNPPKNLDADDEGLPIWLSLRWQRVLERYNEMSEGYDEMDLKNSNRLFTRLLDELKKVKSLEHASSVISKKGDMIMSDNKRLGKSDIGMKNKVLEVIEFLFRKNIMDVSTGISSELIVKQIGGEIKLATPLALLYAGLCPAIRTGYLKRVTMGKTTIIPAYINYLVQELYETKQESEYFKGTEIYAVIDEIGTILRKGVNTPIVDLVVLGRSDGLGLIWANQTYSETVAVSDGNITKNTKYLFCMYNPSKEERRMICNDFNGNGLVMDDILTLGKKGYGVGIECYLMHHEPIVTLDLDSGEREVIETEPIRMALLPPLCEPKKPQGGAGNIEIMQGDEDK